MTQKPIAEFVAQLSHLNIHLLVDSSEGRLRCNAPAGLLTTELRQELAARKAELMAYLAQQPIAPDVCAALAEDTTRSSRSAPAQSFPLSFAQQRLWFLDQLTPGNPFYNVSAAVRLMGTVDQAALEQSFQKIVRRHAALRTCFTTLDGEPVQIVRANIKFEIAAINLSTVSVHDRERISQQLAAAAAQRPFDLTTDSLLRVTLLRFDSTEAVLLLTMHHIVADGWSLGVLIRELACCYSAFVEGGRPELPALSMQYTDFACWQRQWLQGERLASQLAYWQQQLQDLPVLQLPQDFPRPAVQTHRGATYPIQLSAALTQALESLSQQSGASLFMTLLAAFQTLLYRYTGQEDVAIGAPIANRHRSEWEGLIGFFVNSLVLRCDLSGNPTFRMLLAQVRHVALEAYKHQDLPFEKLVETLDPDRDLSRNPLFQVAFALQNAPMQPLELPGLTLSPAPLEAASTRFDLEVHLWEPAHGLRSLWQSQDGAQDGLSGFIAYSTDLFSRDRIGRLVDHYQTLLAGIVADPDAHLSDLPLLTAAEQQQILLDWNQTSAEVTDRCFHQIFEAQAESHPEAIALVSECGALSYRALNQQAEQLAQVLQQKGVRPHEPVGLFTERSAEMVIGILGILKAGAAYLPLDPNYPSERLHFMLSDARAAVVLTQSWLATKLPPPATLIYLDQPLPLHLAPYQAVPVTADHLAYVIYTSGSTGVPKGVLLSHRGLCNRVEAQRRLFHPSRSSRVLQFSSLSFDASIFELALAFGSGGTLYIPPKSAQLPGTALVQFLSDSAITHALLTPAVLAVLPSAELPALQVLITGGEACPSAVVERWAVNRRFFNAYGPTEVTIFATVAELHSGDNPLTIGYPVLNTQVYILDAALNPVPVGTPGELYIGGAGLAQGYLNRPELTAERFVPSPFRAGATEISALIYKTGDRACFRSDGAIEFLGRADHQIKIRGFRVELGEIEATLQRHPAIQAAVVLPLGDTAAEMRLGSYFSLDLHRLQPALQSLQAQQLQHWQTLYDQTYQPDAPHRDPQFDITGWRSSYSGAPIPLEQMQEWVDDRVQQILALKPKRVLEIGCGTGLLLFQIAPHCQRYVGTDFSTVSLNSIQSQLDQLDLPQVELLHQMAANFDGIDPASFDLVILNSIVQYFPSADYLMQVLEGAMLVVKPGGALFLGDLRSLPLLTAFHTWVQFDQADAALERAQLQQRVERSRFEEPELAVDPACFQALRQRFPSIRSAQIRLSRGRHQNEMTQFRYSALLHLDPLESPEAESNRAAAHQRSGLIQHDWQLHPVTVAEIQQQLCETELESLMITNITNSRVNAAVKVSGWISEKGRVNKDSPKTVGRMREILQDSINTAIDPQDWWDLETVLPYSVEITWSAQTHTGDYDVLLIRQGAEVEIDLSHSQLSHSWNHYTNEPLQSPLARQLIPELRQYLQQTLPDYMVPAVFVPLETLPLTANGKVDRASVAAQARAGLPGLDHNSGLPGLGLPGSGLPGTGLPGSANVSLTPNLPLTQIELALADIWQELLRLKQVNVHDNFFELGGHSLLATQMTSRVRDAFGLELSLQSVFATPTIAQLAPILETLRANPAIPKVPPLVRLDRAAHRQQRAQSPQAQSPQAQSPSSTPVLQDLRPPASLPFSEQAFDEQATTNQAFDQSTLSRSPLVPLTLGGSKPPFFCVHPMFGVVFPYLELAHQLGNDRSFYGLQPLGLDGKHPPLTEIAAIADYYIRAMQTLQPHGPYLLGGWSFGGLVAFEMAQQLSRSGQQIQLLAMLDTPAPSAMSVGQSLKFLLGTALWSLLPFLLDYSALAANRLGQSRGPVSRFVVNTALRAILDRLPEESRLQLLDESAIAPLMRIVYANAQAAYRYIPQPYPHRVTLFRATEADTRQDSTLGWNSLARDIQLHEVPGNHLSLLKQPHVQSLAQQLRPYLA